MVDDNYKFLGLLAVFILAIGLAYILIEWPKNIHATFSQHVAVRKQSIVYYAVLFGTILSLLVLFFLRWFVPALHLSIWFSVFVITSSVAQLACTLIPEIGGRRSTYHRLLAGLSATLLIPASTLLLFSENISIVNKATATVGLGVMLLVVFIVSLRKGEPRYFLILQIAYFMAFFIPIMTTAYLR